MGKRRRARKRQSSTALRRNGLQAFKAGDYDEAIEAWGRVGQQTPDMLPQSALAEAYFRRGLDRLYGRNPDRQAGLDDLDRARALQPDDARYVYHLGLASHRQGDLDDAIAMYRIARENGQEMAERVAYPLALALLQQGDDPKKDSIWSALSAEEQTMLSEVKAFRRRPYALSEDAPLLWRGIAAVDAGDHEKAERLLEHAFDKATGPAERQWARYYQGVLAAEQEDWEASLRAWNGARAAGLKMDRLASNLQEASHRLAENLLEAGEVEDALLVGEEALRLGSSYPSLEELVSQAHQRLAHQAASDGRWAEARDHWEAADAAEDGSFRLAYNLALAYERSEDFIAAGERWREALRRRPRKDDHPDAITDEQVARLWQRAAEAYTKAGEYDEAVQVYKNAVKWNPDRLEARLALAEALLDNGQTRAADNELNRILDRDPDNIEALLRLGEVVYAQGYWWQDNPARYWKRVLELDPDNLTARQLLADFYQDQAERAISWGDYDRSLDMYHEALEYLPKNARILAALGGCYLRLEEEEEAEAYLGEALDNASDDLMVYDEIIRAWLDVGNPDLAWRIMDKAEVALPTIPYQFYISIASYCAYDYNVDVMQPWIDRALEEAPPGEPVLTSIGEMAAMVGAFDLARQYLRQAIASEQEPGQAYLVLGIVAIQEGHPKESERHWRKAERIAERTGDEALMDRIEQARFVFSMPPGLLDLVRRFGPGILGDVSFPDF